MNKDPKFYTKKGRLNAYALACGYIEKVEHNGHRLTLYQDGGCGLMTHVTHYSDQDGRIFWETFENITEARKRFDLAKREVLC